MAAETAEGKGERRRDGGIKIEPQRIAASTVRSIGESMLVAFDVLNSTTNRGEKQMTRFEKIHNMKTKIDLAYYLCYLHECPKCPVRFSCRERVNGFIPFMEEPDNYDQFVTMSLVEMSHFLCEWYADCDGCPAEYLCTKEKNGFVAWLNKNVTGEPERNTQIIYRN